MPSDNFHRNAIISIKRSHECIIFVQGKDNLISMVFYNNGSCAKIYKLVFILECVCGIEYQLVHGIKTIFIYTIISHQMLPYFLEYIENHKWTYVVFEYVITWTFVTNQDSQQLFGECLSSLMVNLWSPDGLAQFEASAMQIQQWTI